jgi:hypothetical protein
MRPVAHRTVFSRGTHSRFSLGILAALCLGFFGACPTDGPVDDDAGNGESGMDAGFVGQDAGATADSGPGADAGPAPDAGGGDGDGGNPPTSDGGSSCPSLNPCNGITADGTTLSFTGGANPSVDVGGVGVTIGTSTRAQVEGALGAGTTTSVNPFRTYYCDKAIAVSYVDDVVSQAFQGAVSASDVVAKVSTLEGAVASTAQGAAVGETRTAALADMSGETSANYTVSAATNTQADLFYQIGLSLLSSDGDVISMTAATPLGADHYGLAMDLLDQEVGSISASVLDGTSFSSLDGILGTGYDADGFLDSAVSGASADVRVRIYANAGIRLAGLCDSGAPACADSKVSNIVLTSPFMGTDNNGIGLGSTKSEIEAQYTLDSTETDAQTGQTLHIYEGAGGILLDRFFGVLYIQGSDCEERAAAFVLNYVSL